MPIVTQSLLDFAIPDVRQVLTSRDAAFYALSVGAGQDPMDRAELAFADPDRGPLLLPSIVVVLCHPGFWLADPATGVDAGHVVHGEQGFRIHHLPPLGTPILGRTRVTGVVDKGPGRGALIYSEKQLIDEATGAVYATATATIFARADGGFSGPSGPVSPAHVMPATDPVFTIDRATRPEQALYYRLNGDMNPLHSDPAAAAKAGFPRPILHGLCTLGVVCTALIQGLCRGDPARLLGLDLRFSAPVFPGETIRVEMWPDGSFRARVEERGVIVVNNGMALVEECGFSPGPSMSGV